MEVYTLTLNLTTPHGNNTGNNTAIITWRASFCVTKWTQAILRGEYTEPSSIGSRGVMEWRLTVVQEVRGSNSVHTATDFVCVIELGLLYRS